MKSLFILTAIVAGTLFTSKSDAQVYVGARFGRVGVRVGVPVYNRPYFCAPAPAPIDYDEFPGYAYYNYPVWNGHFRDRVYYEHYRPVFFREHPRYHAVYHGRRW